MGFGIKNMFLELIKFRKDGAVNRIYPAIFKTFQ
jgi:hypothetical protein